MHRAQDSRAKGLALALGSYCARIWRGGIRQAALTALPAFWTDAGSAEARNPIQSTMSYHPDLSAHVCGNSYPDPHVLNIGWLSKEHPFLRGTVPEGFYAALCRLARTPVNLYQSEHCCEFCAAPQARQFENGAQLTEPLPGTFGNGEIWVPGPCGITYVAPVIIVHYIGEHHFRPMQEFINAVLKFDESAARIGPVEEDMHARETGRAVRLNFSRMLADFSRSPGPDSLPEAG
jgi:hypothetical protein